MIRKWGRPLWFMLFLLLPIHAFAANFEVESARLYKHEGAYYLNASFNLETAARLRELLEQGLAVTLVTEAKVEAPRPLIWGDTVALVRQVRRVQYHPLTRLYIIDEPSTGLRRIFPNWAQALAALQQVRDMPVVDDVLLSPGQDYDVYVRVRLSTSALPLGLRFSAMISDWGMDSEWKRIPLRP